MDAQPAVFSGTLKVRACHVFWTKTPVQLTYHRLDFRHALPVLLIRRPRLLGGEFRVPLDPCIHPVRLLPVSRSMAAKLEFALEYGWHTTQVRLRAPDASTYRQWTRLVSAALESGRRPLASCSSTVTAEPPRNDLEYSSLASTLNSSNHSTSRFNTTIRSRVHEQEEDTTPTHDNDLGGQAPSDFFVLHHDDYHPYSRLVTEDNFHRPSWPLASPRSAAVGSCSCISPPQGVRLPKVNRDIWQPHFSIHGDSAASIRELLLQTSSWFLLL